MPPRELPQQFGPLDAVFLNFERKEMPLHIGSVSICDGALPFDQFVASIERKLDLLPRYRQKAVRPFLDIGLPTWQYDPKFDIRTTGRRQCGLSWTSGCPHGSTIRNSISAATFS